MVANPVPRCKDCGTEGGKLGRDYPRRPQRIEGRCRECHDRFAAGRPSASVAGGVVASRRGALAGRKTPARPSVALLVPVPAPEQRPRGLVICSRAQAESIMDAWLGGGSPPNIAVRLERP